MPYNGSGGTSQPANSIYPATGNTLIESAKANASIADIYTMLANVICKDGQTTITANIPMAGFKLTGLGAGTSAGHSVRYEQVFTTTALTDAATISWDAGLAPSASVTLGGSRTMAAPTNLKAGGTYTLIVTQDAVGNRTLTWNAVFKGQGGSTMPQPEGTAASVTTFNFISDGTNLYILQGIGKMQTRQVLTSGSGATYTTPSRCRGINVRMIGGGGGGGAYSTNAGSAGNDTTFGTLTAGGGGGGAIAAGAGGAGGTATNGDINIPGAKGQGGAANTVANIAVQGGSGGSSPLGGGGGGGDSGAAGYAAATNSGSGGGGGGADSTTGSGAGGGAGGYVEKFIASPAATYTYTVGTGGNGGAGGGNGGGNGAAGIIIVDEFY